MRHKSPRVLGFDPGFERLGAAVLQKKGRHEILVHSACIRTSATLPFPERLCLIGEAAEKLILDFKPTAVAIEKVYFEKNAKTAMRVAEVCGVLTYLAASHRLPFFSYTPLQIKAAVTGSGAGSKADMARMLPRLIALPTKKRLDDEMDAIATALTCLVSERGLR